MKYKEPKKGSGKQVLLKILTDLSTKITKDPDMDHATNQLRAGLLLHGSTAPDTHEAVERVCWSSSSEDGEIWRQGIATVESNIFISDLFEEMWDDENIKSIMLSKNKNLNDDNYEACMEVMWLVLSSVQMFEELLSVETKEEIDIERWVKGLTRQRWHYFNDK